MSNLVDEERRDSKEITIETQPEISDPIKVGVEFDIAAPLMTFDPNNFDPNNFDPNTIDLDTFDETMFDPENFDPANFLPQPLETEEVIGPKGGELTVTGSNGVVYTLVVPPDALRMDVPIKLRAISALSGLPLSGGLLAGVIIEPTTLRFRYTSAAQHDPTR